MNESKQATTTSDRFLCDCGYDLTNQLPRQQGVPVEFVCPGCWRNYRLTLVDSFVVSRPSLPAAARDGRRTIVQIDVTQAHIELGAPESRDDHALALALADAGFVEPCLSTEAAMFKYRHPSGQTLAGSLSVDAVRFAEEFDGRGWASPTRVDVYVDGDPDMLATLRSGTREEP